MLPQSQPLPQPPPRKPGEGWGGRGARLPKIPVPLPSLPPSKGGGHNYSHSFEEVEDDLFLDRCSVEQYNDVKCSAVQFRTVQRE